MYLLGILCLVVATAALPVLPDPPKLSNSVAAHQDSKIHTFQNAATAPTPLRDEKDNEKIEKHLLKIASVVFSPPRLLPRFYDSILKKHKTNRKQIYEDRVKQKATNSKREKESVVPKKSLEVEILPGQGRLTNFKKGFNDCEVCANILILTSGAAPVAHKKDDDTYVLDSETAPQDSDVRDINLSVTTDSSMEADKKDNEEVRHKMVKIATEMPPPPELTPFDYSILRKQNADHNLKYDFSMKQSTEKYKEDKETVIVDLEKQVKIDVPPNPPTLPDSVLAHPVSEKINYGENVEAKINMVKVAPIVIPPPPELPQFDYSVLKQQLAGQERKYNDALKQEAKKSKEDKEVVIPDLPTLPDSVDALPVSEVISASKSGNEEAKVNRVKIASIHIPPPPELPPFDYSILKKQKADHNLKYDFSMKQSTEKYKEDKKVVIPDLPTLPDSVDALPVSKVTSASESGNEKATVNMVRIDSIHIPPPPELPPFDYSILKKQNADHNLKYDFSMKQSTEKYKEDKETVIVDLEKQVKIDVPPNPPTLPDSVLAHPVSEKINYGENIEAKINMVKVAPIVIPPPPELPQFDYSVLKQQLAGQERKYNDALKQEAKKSKEDKEVVIPDLPTLPDSVDALPVSEVISASKSGNEEAKVNRVKIASIHIPPPPELPPFDYSILKKQKADHNLKYDFSMKQSTEKYKEDKEVIIPDLPTLPDSVDALPVSEMTSASESGNEEAKVNMVRIDSIHIPPPPELPPFDYSILKKQNADHNLKYDFSMKQSTEKYKEDKETVIVDLEKQVKIDVPPNPPTLPDSVLAHPVSEKINYGENIEAKINMVKVAPIVIPPPPELPQFDYSVLKQQLAGQERKYNDALKQEAKKSKEDKEVVIPDLPTLPDSVDALPVSEVISASKSGNEEAKVNRVKIASIHIPPPPELPPFDYSILKKQKADHNLKYDFSMKQSTEKYKEDKEVIIPDLPTLPDSVDALPVSEVISASKSGNEEAKVNRVQIASIHIPPPPELPPFDYSILKKQKADHNLKYDFSMKQSTEKYKEDKEVIIPDLPTLPDSVDALPVSEVISASKSGNEEAKVNMVRIDSIHIPPPPELPPFDYSILKKQNADHNMKYDFSMKQSTEKSKEDKEVVIPDLPTLPDSVDALPVSEVTSASESGNEEAKVNMVRIDSIHIPPPPELPPFDYSILKKQNADHNLKYDFSMKQSTEKYKDDKETVIVDLEKQVKIDVPPNPPTLPDSVLAHPVSEKINYGENVEAKINMVKVAPIVIPPPPELPQFDYSVLKKQIAGQKQKFNDLLIKQEDGKSKREKGFAIEKPVEIKFKEPKLVEESKFVGVSKPIEGFIPVEEFKPSELLIKEPVKHSEDIPVNIQLTIPSATFLSKLTSNCPPLQGFGLNWPYQKSAMSRCPHLIYPKFDIDGKIYTN